MRKSLCIVLSFEFAAACRVVGNGSVSSEEKGGEVVKVCLYARRSDLLAVFAIVVDLPL